MVTECYHPVRNGVVSAIDWAVTGLRKRGHDLRIVAPQIADWTDSDPDVIRLPSIGNPFYPLYPAALPWFRQWQAKLEKFQPDLIHTHSFFWLSRWALKFARKRGWTVVTTFHTRVEEYLHYSPFPRFLSRFFLRYWMRTFYRQCARVLLVSPLTEGQLRGLGVCTPVRYAPTGVDEDRFAPAHDKRAVRRQLALPEDGTLVIYVGRLAKEKNLPFLLSSLTPLLQHQNQCYLILVGDGAIRGALEGYVQSAGLAQRVVFAGSQPRDKIALFLSACDIFVFPSLTETQGLAVVEAMMCALPVVAIRAGGPAISIDDGETGLLTEPDETAFREAVETLVKDRSRAAAMGRLARDRASLRFSSSACLSVLEKAYQESVSAPSQSQDGT